MGVASPVARTSPWVLPRKCPCRSRGQNDGRSAMRVAGHVWASADANPTGNPLPMGSRRPALVVDCCADTHVHGRDGADARGPQPQLSTSPSGPPMPHRSRLASPPPLQPSSVRTAREAGQPQQRRPALPHRARPVHAPTGGRRRPTTPRLALARHSAHLSRVPRVRVKAHTRWPGTGSSSPARSGPTAVARASRATPSP
jgi:hypothetical protein